jgi:DNA-binding MarR family transcriptional regulator
VLENELLAAQQLSLASYDVLVQLAEAPGQRLRMTELADAVLLSRSGVTRLVDRLEKGGLVARGRVDSDGRGVVAVLTQYGFERLKAATGTHLGGVALHFAGSLDGDELVSFGRTCERLAETHDDEQTDTTADIAKAEHGDQEDSPTSSGERGPGPVAGNNGPDQ